jgi:hypothetical protein
VKAFLYAKSQAIIFSLSSLETTRWWADRALGEELMSPRSSSAFTVVRFVDAGRINFAVFQPA